MTSNCAQIFTRGKDYKGALPSPVLLSSGLDLLLKLVSGSLQPCEEAGWPVATREVTAAWTTDPKTLCSEWLYPGAEGRMTIPDLCGTLSKSACPFTKQKYVIVETKKHPRSYATSREEVFLSKLEMFPTCEDEDKFENKVVCSLKISEIIHTNTNTHTHAHTHTQEQRSMIWRRQRPWHKLSFTPTHLHRLSVPGVQSLQVPVPAK